MNKDEKQGMIGLAVIAVVLMVGGYFIYNTFFTYSTYAECVGDRTSEPGLSNAQVKTQRDYCGSYFAQRAKPKKKKTDDQIEKEERFAIKNCTTRFGDWTEGSVQMPNNTWVDCGKYQYLKKCVKSSNNVIIYLPYPNCKGGNR